MSNKNNFQSLKICWKQKNRWGRNEKPFILEFLSGLNAISPRWWFLIWSLLWFPRRVVRGGLWRQKLPAVPVLPEVHFHGEGRDFSALQEPPGRGRSAARRGPERRLHHPGAASRQAGPLPQSRWGCFLCIALWISCCFLASVSSRWLWESSAEIEPQIGSDWEDMRAVFWRKPPWLSWHFISSQSYLVKLLNLKTKAQKVFLRAAWRPGVCVCRRQQAKVRQPPCGRQRRQLAGRPALAFCSHRALQQAGQPDRGLAHAALQHRRGGKLARCGLWGKQPRWAGLTPELPFID